MSHSNVLYGDFGRQYPTMVKGESVYVYDDRGKQYLDAVGGVGVVNVGHGVTEIVAAVAEQTQRLAFTYGGEVDNVPRQTLASKLADWAPPGMGKTKIFFCSGGAEANEAALKIAYQYHWERGHSSKRKVIGRWQSYHGNTIGTLSIGGRTNWRRMHSPFLLDSPHIAPPYCYRCPWDKEYPSCGIQCAIDLERVITQEGPENISAFIAEPIVGTSMSAVAPPAEYYKVVREICDRHDVLFIADEVVTGVGRTGKKWGIDHWQVAPDIITAGKGITGGYAPLAVAILGEKVWRAIAGGSGTVTHSCTYGGNPVSCAAGVATMEFIEKHDLVERVRVTGARLTQRLNEELGDLPSVGDIRGIGLLNGVELVRDKVTRRPFPADWKVAARVEEHAFERGLLVLRGMSGLIDGVDGDHVELIPPYVIDDVHIEQITKTLRDSIVTVMAGLPA